MFLEVIMSQALFGIGERELAAIEDLLFQQSELLRRVHRWAHFRSIPRAELETVETHLLNHVWLAAIMLALEQAAGRNKIDGMTVLTALSVHDIGEGAIGDVRFAVKQDPRVRAPLKEMERDAAADLFRNLPPPAREFLSRAFQVEGQEETIEGRFFDAVERIGYMLYAVMQVRLDRMELVEVFHLQHRALFERGIEFPSCAALYAPYRAMAVEVHNANQGMCSACRKEGSLRTLVLDT
jgi:5'-deoxynucleotidase YfbR-like HD superfamily hydrolase